MGRKYLIDDQNGIYFVTFTAVAWIDLFTRAIYCDIILNNLKYCKDNKGLNVHAFCIMSNHIHLILSADLFYNLSDIIRDFKSYTSKELFKSIKLNVFESRRVWMISLFKECGKRNSRNIDFQIWQQHNHPIQLWSDKFMDQKLTYIHNNPLVAGFVDDPNAWKWSSCAAYELGKDCGIELDFLR